MFCFAIKRITNPTDYFLYIQMRLSIYIPTLFKYASAILYLDVIYLINLYVTVIL